MHKNSVWKNNIRKLEEKDPALASRVKNVSKDSSHKLIHSRNRYPNVIVMREHDAILLYDNEDPIRYCREYLERLQIQYAPIVLFCGLGLGYHLDLFFKEHSKRLETHEIIIFEEDVQLFRMALEVGDFQEILSHPNIDFIVGEDPKNIIPRIQSILTEENNRTRLKSLKIIALPANLQLNKKYYLSAVDAAKRASQQVMIKAGNDSFDSILGLENLLANIKHIISNPGINLLYGKFKSKPAVVIASGPSLNKNIHLLKDLRDRALIICCDPSFKPIMKRGIRPHLVASLERTPGTEKFFLNIQDFEGIYYAACPVLMPKALEAFKGQKIITYRAFSHFDWIGIDKGCLDTGPSVANMAFKIAKALGCDPIILIGQDLAFGDDGDTHVKEAVYGERDEWYHKTGVFEVEGNNGKPVKTTKIWDVFRITYEADLEKYQGTCINATEGGARIRGTKVMSFKDAIIKYCSEVFSPQKIIQKAISDFSVELDVRNQLVQVLKKAKETRKGIDDVIKEFKILIDEMNVLHNEEVQPYLLYEKTPDMERIGVLVNKFKALTATHLIGNKAVLEIMAHSLQAYDVWASNEFYFLNSIYSNENCLAIAKMLRIHEWLKNVAQFLVCTRDILEKAEERLNEEMGKRDRELDSLEARGVGAALP